MFILETERLQLRQYTQDDHHFTFELMNSESWLKYIGDRKISSPEVARDYIKKAYLPSYIEHGYGAYVVVLKETGRPIGACDSINVQT